MKGTKREVRPRGWRRALPLAPRPGSGEVRRLSGLDSGLLVLELPIQPMHLVSVVVLRPFNQEPLALDDLRRHLADRLDALPALRWRMVRVPGGIARPVLIEDPAFDLDQHLDEQHLRAPGDDAQLDGLLADAGEHRLDRGRPLWQLTLVHNLSGGRQALVLRIHHCLVDGSALMNILASLSSGPARAGGQTPEAVPPAGRLLLSSVREQGRSARLLPALIRRTRRASSVAKAERAGSPAPPPERGDVPATVLNKAFVAERRLARASFAVADINIVKDMAGVTFNDVLLAMVAGSFRAYLLARGALPDRPLVARVPVSLEPAGSEPRTFGNRFSALFTSLATDLEDPSARLQRIAAVTAEAKRLFWLTGSELLDDWLALMPPLLWEKAARLDAWARRRHPERIDANVTVSNVRGPAFGGTIGSAAVEELYLTGPPNSGVGVNITALDYGERLYVGILTVADCVEEPAELAEGMHGALKELLGG